MQIINDRAKQANERTSGQGYTKVNWYKPKMGENALRLLPNPSDANAIYWKECLVHYIPIQTKKGMVRVTVRSLVDFGEECPIMKHYDEMFAKDPTAAKGARPQRKFLFNVIDYSEVSGSPIKVWAIGVQLFDQLMNYLAQLQSKGTNLDEDFDFKLIKKTSNRAGGMPDYQLIPVMKKTAVPGKIKDLIQSQSCNLNEIYQDNRRKEIEAFVSYVLKRNVSNEQSPQALTPSNTPIPSTLRTAAKTEPGVNTTWTTPVVVQPPVQVQEKEVEDEFEAEDRPTAAKVSFQDEVLKKELESLGLKL